MIPTLIINAILVAAIAYMVCDTAALRYKQKRQINIYIDETNKLAIVAPQKKASDEDIDEVFDDLDKNYIVREFIKPDVKIKGAYRK
ncbi:hypothetical protein [Staphylococcus equorum]|uniref:Uncharacterized protein n=1 Tax=Staphylococcus equorum TaxID=246432 RepID=A0AAP7LTR6_9STAP|nr:hypothetical protein [Staphylococcus equorum]MDW4443352.1 hypothetical protein [Staphylococcus saprophyticus]MDK9859266.1 hypothetical protein [Staphylococcus equorum]OEK55729.1 hypothetical protein ASS94_09000 [Staphylococcus equorum]OEK56582.1 hypothetical protein ASS97_06020 [Staphylococcus equorum]OEK63590.1 hypothetical protein ASS99_01225 [Staphylococcus equorum]